MSHTSQNSHVFLIYPTPMSRNPYHRINVEDIARSGRNRLVTPRIQEGSHVHTVEGGNQRKSMGTSNSARSKGTILKNNSIGGQRPARLRNTVNVLFAAIRVCLITPFYQKYDDAAIWTPVFTIFNAPVCPENLVLLHIHIILHLVLKNQLG